MVDKRALILILILGLTINANALEEYELPEGSLPQDEDPFISQAQQNVRQLSEISARIDQARNENKQFLESATSLVLTQMLENQSMTIILFVLISLASQGISWAVFLYLKSRGRL